MLPCSPVVVGWLGIMVSCGGANYPAIFHIWVSLLIGRLVWYGVGMYFPATPRSSSSTTLREQRLREQRLREQRNLLFYPMACHPWPSTVPVPMVAGPKVPAALSLAFFFYCCFVLFYWWSATVCHTRIYVFSVKTKWNISKRPQNRNGVPMFLVHLRKVW